MSKLCKCGCGNETTLAVKTDRRRGDIKGKPVRYIIGHHKGRSRPILPRLYGNVKLVNDCWEFLGYRDKAGYGIIRYGRKQLHASRVSYELANGPFSENLLVCHKCDNPPCINPEHLFLGTHKDNMLDSLRKGRQPSKLSMLQVLEIRKIAPSGRELQLMAEQFNVSNSTIYNVLNSTTHKHVQ